MTFMREPGEDSTMGAAKRCSEHVRASGHLTNMILLDKDGQEFTPPKHEPRGTADWAARYIGKHRDRAALWIGRLRRESPDVYDAVLLGAGLVIGALAVAMIRDAER